MEDRLLDSIMQEVERLITAPYAPSFQDIYDLTQGCSTASLRQWALFKPCQVALLVDVLVEGLARSAYAVRLLATFVSIAAFRDALLKKYSSLFDQFLAKVVDEDDLQFLPVCTGLLSAPLSSGVVIPARLAMFITKLVDGMGRNPCEETILPLHKLMAGLKASPGVVTSLPPETMSTVQVEFTKILRNLANPTDTLLCLATCARITALQNSRTELHGDGSCPPWLQYMRDFFGPKRAAKSLDLTVLHVIFACSASSTNLSAEKATESIRLAVEICDAVSIEQRQAWAATNQPKVMKLCEKVTRADISPDLQMMGVAFLAALLPAAMIPQEVSDIGRSMLLLSNCRKLLEILSDEHIERLVEALTLSFGESIVREFCQFALATLAKTRPTGYEDVARLCVAGTIISGLQKHFPQLFTKATSVLSGSGKSTIVELVASFPRQPCRSQCDESPICFAATAKSQNSLIVDILTVQAFRQSTRESESDPRTVFMTSLITKLRNIEFVKDCSFRNAESTCKRERFTLPAFQDPAPECRSSRNWRDHLASSIMENANVSRIVIVQKVEEICRDLESRCLNVEGPLRQAEAERDQFSVKHAQLQQEHSLQSRKLQEALTTVTSLQEEVGRLEEQLEATTEQVAQLSANLESAHRELTTQQRDSQEIAAFEREKARTRELDLMATITAKEDQIEELHQQLRGQKAETDGARSNLTTITSEKSTLMEMNSKLQQEISFLRESTRASEARCLERDERIADLRGEKERLSRELQSLQAKLHDEVAESERLRASLHRAENQAVADLEALQRQHQHEISQITNESSKHKAESTSLREKLKVAESSAKKERESKDKRIQHLERKIQSMRDERAAKAREFSEAQQHISRLMTVMGFKAEPHSAHDSSKPRSSSSNANASQIVDVSMHSQPLRAPCQHDSPRVRTLDHIAEDEALLETPRVSLGSIASQYSSSSGRPLSLRQRSDRRTLSEADGNSQSGSPVRHEPKQSQYSEQQQHENNIQNLDLDLDLQFSRDSFFASTSHS